VAIQTFVVKMRTPMFYCELFSGEFLCIEIQGE